MWVGARIIEPRAWPTEQQYIMMFPTTQVHAMPVKPVAMIDRKDKMQVFEVTMNVTHGLLTK